VRWVLVVALIAGCKQPRREVTPPPPPGPARGAFAMTYYWTSVPPPSGEADTKLFGKGCTVLATVPAAYAKEMTLQGTGRLPDGRTLVVTGECPCARSPCFRDETKNPWGTGAAGRGLVPYRSIAVDKSVVPLGTRLWIEELDGVALPDAPLALHDGCVIADDTGGRIKGSKLDFFVGEEANYRVLDRVLHDLERVTVHDGGARCP
jgi:3D (Asp-Asp-Asp) domain-containing protein